MITVQNWWFEDGHRRIHSECGPCHTEHGLREYSSACQQKSGDWRGTLWTLLVTFCIVIIRCTETLLSPHIYIGLYICIYFFFLWRCDPTRVMASSFLRFLDYTQRRTIFGRTPLDEWSARRRDLYLTTHSTHTRQTSMPPVGFEPTISAVERPQTYALDHAATGTGVTYTYTYTHIYICVCLPLLYSFPDASQISAPSATALYLAKLALPQPL